MKTARAIATLTMWVMFAAVLTGCVRTHVKSPSGWEFSRTAFGNNTQVGSVTITTNGSVTIHGYANDQAQAIGVAIDAAVKAAVTAAKP